MDLIITNASIITGDGSTLHPTGQIGISRGKIVSVVAGAAQTGAAGAKVLDAQGATVMPGIINAHAHGCVHGPAMPSGSQPVAPADINWFRNRHLLAGTTSLLNVCGFPLPDEAKGETHPLQIFVTSSHTPSSIAAADDIDGTGLKSAHRAVAASRVITEGAIALGEGGGGQTLGGGAQDYRFLPQAIGDATGVTVNARQARQLKETLLGRRLDRPINAPGQDFVGLCHGLGFYEREAIARLAALIQSSVIKPMRNAFLGMTELAELSAQTGVPAILHNALPSTDHILSLAQQFPKARIIAAHSNHPSFTPAEAVASAKRLKEAGVLTDVSTLDCISTHWRNNAENLDALIAESLVDTLSTDFAGGHWDSILEAVHRMITTGQRNAPQAIALATGNVAGVFPAFRDRGRLEVGKRADLVIADSRNLSRVRHVLIEGKAVVYNGGWAR